MCFGQMKKDSDFLERKDEVADFNSKHKWLKRGISMTHCRFVCSHLAAAGIRLVFGKLFSAQEAHWLSVQAQGPQNSAAAASCDRMAGASRKV